MVARNNYSQFVVGYDQLGDAAHAPCWSFSEADFDRIPDRVHHLVRVGDRDRNPTGRGADADGGKPLRQQRLADGAAGVDHQGLDGRPT